MFLRDKFIWKNVFTSQIKYNRFACVCVHSVPKLLNYNLPSFKFFVLTRMQSLCLLLKMALRILIFSSGKFYSYLNFWQLSVIWFYDLPFVWNYYLLHHTDNLLKPFRHSGNALLETKSKLWASISPKLSSFNIPLHTIILCVRDHRLSPEIDR